VLCTMIIYASMAVLVTCSTGLSSVLCIFMSDVVLGLSTPSIFLLEAILSSPTSSAAAFLRACWEANCSL
jgi:hypothetical protein